MKVQLDKSYPMPCSVEVAWEFLRDIESVASCMPGAAITERVDAGRYKGTVTVRVGPATMSFRGEVEMRDVDPATRTLRLLGKGSDAGSVAAMDLTARIEPAPANRCTLVGSSEVTMSGRAATFGGRMMAAVSDQVLQKFADNFAARVGELEVNSAPAPASPPSTAAAAPAARELDGLALAWAVLKDWLRRLFGGKAA
jgi:hypothetical protein